MDWLWLWFGLTVILLLVEVLTVDLVCIWFSVAALVTGVILGIFPTLPLPWQLAIFVLLSVVLLIVTRPLIKRFRTNEPRRDLNLERLIGRVAVVTETVDNRNGTGAVRLGGVVWTARALDDSVIEAGATVTFEKIEGNKALVKRKGE